MTSITPDKPLDEIRPDELATVKHVAKQDFIRQIIRDDLASGRHTAPRTRFPPEPVPWQQTLLPLSFP